VKNNQDQLSMDHSAFNLKYYVIGIIDYLLAILVFWDNLDHWLRAVAAIGVIISTWYLIKKYKSESELNQLKKEKEKLDIREKELDLMERERKMTA
jgi:hypothetical protein